MTEAAPEHWIVVPCYNEALRLPVNRFLKWLPLNPAFGVLFVDDGSTDDTAGAIAPIVRACPAQARFLQLAHNSGKGEAIRQGLLQLLETPVQTVGYLDADLATPLEELPVILESLQRSRSDIAMGSRVRLLGRDIARNPWRHYFGRIFAAMASLTLGLAVYDTQCGAKLFAVSDATGVLVKEPFVSRWVFDVEILARYLRRLRKLQRWPAEPCGLIEVPLNRWHDVAGSKVRSRDFLRAFADLCKIIRVYGFGNDAS